MAVSPARPITMPDPLAPSGEPCPAALCPADARARRVTHAMHAGERSALAELFGMRCTFVEREAAHALGHRADLTPDAAQDAWVRVARRSVVCDTAHALDAWLRRVAVSAAVDLLRAELARRAREQRVSRTRAEASSFAADAAQLDTARRALAELDADDRSILELRARTGATLAQLAAALGIGAAAVDSRLRRAAGRARQAIEDANHP